MIKTTILLPLFVLAFPLSLHSGHFFVPNTELKAAKEEAVYTFIADVSAYSIDEEQCGKTDGITASGTVATEGRTIACDHLPINSRVRINGQEYIVEDRFGGNYSNRIDIYMDSEDDCWKFGRQNLCVEVLEEG